MLAADRMGGFSAGLGDLPVAFGALRRRLLDMAAGLPSGDWDRPSRCDLWTVHDVVRHVRDGCRVHVIGLNHDGRSPLDEPFDARDTPRQWLERTAGEAPEATMDALRGLCDEEEAALGTRVEDFHDETVMAPYGPVHWTVLSAHVFWDAWIHQRDVLLALGRSDGSTAVEDRFAAHYGLLIASMPAMHNGYRFETTVSLTGDDGTGYTAAVGPGRVEVREGAATGEEDLWGQLAPVVDALAGRGDLEHVLAGEASRREPLTWLRAILAPQA